MKAVMYHYVRPGDRSLPEHPYLHIDDFRRQLDYFESRYGFVSREAFQAWRAGGPAPDGVLLTFDDGLTDHLVHVLPELSARGVFGLFYVASGPILEGRFLDVHKVHLAVGRLGGERALRWLAENHPGLVQDLSGGSVGHYAAQQSNEATKRIKRLFNWQLSAHARREALDGLFSHAFDGAPPDWREFYLDEAGIKRLAEAGMGVGGHGQQHAILSHLPEAEQRTEIEPSCDLVRSLVGHLEWGFCYAHGIAEAIDETSQRIVRAAGCPFAFAVADHDIARPIADEPRYALPRYNCNAFPHGEASFGASPRSHRAR